MPQQLTPEQIEEKKAKRRAYIEAWWKAHPEQRRAKDRRRSERRKEWRKEYRKRYRKTHAAVLKEAAKRFRKSETRKRYWRQYYAENGEAIRECSRVWAKKNPGKVLQHGIKRRLRQKAASSNTEIIRLFIDDVKSRKTVRCYYCERIVPTRKIHFDHVVPLSKGGAHSIENICVSCSTCNLHKQATPIQDWYKLGQQILAL